MKGNAGQILTDYVIYDKNDEVIAIGTRGEIRNQLGYTENSMDCLLARPLAGWTVVKFRRGEYRCTTQGITDKVSNTFIFQRRERTITK